MKDPRVIVITGASRGIGEGLAKAYADSGRTLMIIGRNAERLEAVAEACRAKGAEVLPTIADVADREAMDRLLTDFDRQNPIDLVIANAGIGHGSGKYLMEVAEQTQEVIDINVAGVTNTVMPLVNRMAARGRGQIAMVSSIAGFAALTQAVSYSASKAFVKFWGEGLRGRMKPFGVEVTVICPGYIKGEFTANNRYPMPFLMEPDKATRIMKRSLEAGKGRVAFPWQMSWGAGLLGALPSFVAQSLTSLKRKSKLPPIE